MFEVVEVMRRVLRCILEAMEGGLSLLAGGVGGIGGIGRVGGVGGDAPCATLYAGGRGG